MSNTANYDSNANWGGTVDGNVTTVGSNGGPSAYGTYDQGGNTYEWTDLDGTPGSFRGLRGGGWIDVAFDLSSSYDVFTNDPAGESLGIGFRLASSLNPLNLSNFVVVGDANNAADTNGYGSVSTNYLIGKCSVTNCEYAAFLNAVDPEGTNPQGIYNANINSDARVGITLNSGNANGQKYVLKANMGNKPVVLVSWFDCARYCNWLHNEALTYNTTAAAANVRNTGAYNVGTATTGNAVAKEVGATYHIPTENQWYKAAYYKGGGTNAGYWVYATQSDTAPTPVTASSIGDGLISGQPANVSEYVCPTTTATTTTTVAPVTTTTTSSPTNTTTTVSPIPDCDCGSLSLPIGAKYSPSGLYLRAEYDNTYVDLKLTHNQPANLRNGQLFVVTTERINTDKNIVSISGELISDYDDNLLTAIQRSPIAINNLYLLTKTPGVVIENQIKVVTKLYSSQEIIDTKYLNTLGQVTPFSSGTIDQYFSVDLDNNCDSTPTFDLFNDRIQVEIYSLCDFFDEDCCDFSTQGWDIWLRNTVNQLSTFCCSATTTTTTTTTIKPTTTTTTTTTVAPTTTTTTTTTTEPPCCDFANIQFRTYNDPNILTVYDKNNQIILSTGPIITGGEFITIVLDNINQDFKVCVDDDPAYCYEFDCEATTTTTTTTTAEPCVDSELCCLSEYCNNEPGTYMVSWQDLGRDALQSVFDQCGGSEAPSITCCNGKIVSVIDYQYAFDNASGFPVYDVEILVQSS